jgi:hypothetical protein
MGLASDDDGNAASDTAIKKILALSILKHLTINQVGVSNGSTI